MNKNETLDLIQESLNCADRLFEQIPTKLERTEVYQTSLIMSLSDITKDVMCLAKENRLLSIPSLVRSFMDSYIDYLLLEKDKDYMYSFLVEDYKKKIKVFDYLISTISETNDLENINKKKEELELNIKSIKDCYTVPKLGQIIEKYKAVDMYWFYKTLYNDLCAHTHNSPEKIEYRHIGQNNDKIILKYFQKYNFNDYSFNFSFLVYFFHDALKRLNELLSLKQDNLINELDIGVTQSMLLLHKEKTSTPIVDC